MPLPNQGTTTVSIVNGWNIVREVRGAGTWWYARASCPAGYLIEEKVTGTRGEAERHAETHAVPPPPVISPEIQAQRERNTALVAEMLTDIGPETLRRRRRARQGD